MVMPPTAGKKPTLVMNTLSAISPGADPAYEAHILPIKGWATAWWEHWSDQQQMHSTFDAAVAKLAEASNSGWQRVTGPAAATAASARRIGWMSTSAWQGTDDIGDDWDFKVDPPAAIGNAVKQSVERWRTEQLLK
jgi:hypothetical protein